MTDRISMRALNRATLARQLLLERSTMGPLEAIRHLVGLQAQAPWAPYHQLLCRLEGTRPDDIGQLLLRREVVRISAMRGTIHLLTVDDALAIRPVVQVVLDRELRANKERRDALEGVDIDAVAAAGRALVDTDALTPGELGDHLTVQFPGVAPEALATVVRMRVPVVQTTPRAVWGRQGAPRLTTLSTWLADRVDPDRSGTDGPPTPMPLDELVRRHLAAFGPATVKDIQTWCGLTRLGAVVDAMADELVQLTGEDGALLHDLPDAPRPGEDVEAPPRLLGEFDNLTLSYADRRRVIPDAHRSKLTTRNGMPPATFTVGGEVAGTWRITRTTGSRTRDGSAAVEITPWEKLPRGARPGLEAEGRRLLSLVAPEAGGHVVRIVAR